MGMETFGVLLIAVDDYPDPPGPLPSSESADRLAELIIGERGGRLIERLVGKSREEIIGALEKLGARQRRPAAVHDRVPRRPRHRRRARP